MDDVLRLTAWQRIRGADGTNKRRKQVAPGTVGHSLSRVEWMTAAIAPWARKFLRPKPASATDKLCLPLRTGGATDRACRRENEIE